MCGHVGVAGTLDKAAVLSFKDMLFFDTLRGSHGTGIAAVPREYGKRNKDGITILKAPVTAPVWLENKAVDSLLTRADHSVLLGHNRHATQGEWTQSNTHPFKFSDDENCLVGAHNGTITASHMKSLPLVDEVDYGTDSETVLYHIAEEGAASTMANVSENGAWAFVWYESEDNTINFLRNENRPFYYAFSKDRKQLFWSSEKGILYAACTRPKGLTNFAPRVELETINKKSEIPKIYELPLNTQFTWAVPHGTLNTFADAPTKTKCPPKKYVAPARTYPAYDEERYSAWAMGGYSHNSSGDSRETSKVVPFRSKAHEAENALDVTLAYTSYTSKQLAEMFDDLGTCIMCPTKVTKEDLKKGNGSLLHEDMVLCGHCSNEAASVLLIKDLELDLKSEVA